MWKSVQYSGLEGTPVHEAGMCRLLPGQAVRVVPDGTAACQRRVGLVLPPVNHG